MVKLKMVIGDGGQVPDGQNTLPIDPVSGWNQPTTQHDGIPGGYDQILGGYGVTEGRGSNEKGLDLGWTLSTRNQANQPDNTEY